VAEEEEEICRSSTGQPNLVDAAGDSGAEREEAETRPPSSRGVGAEAEVETVEKASR